VIFPQFAASGPLPRHGFARTRCWQESMRTERSATLRLQPDAQLLAIWPQTFTAELGLAIDGAGLEITLAVRNDGKTPLQFTAALHTYLAVDALDELRIDGLGGRRYRDSADRGVERVQQAAELAIGGEVDRIYFGAGDGAVRVEEPARACRITQTGFSDVVVWNPGPVKGAALADMPPDGWQRMVCVEAAAVERPVELAPGAMWIGTQALRATR
jgi:glucose-6-phosphate 1-epimerase